MTIRSRVSLLGVGARPMIVCHEHAIPSVNLSWRLLVSVMLQGLV